MPFTFINEKSALGQKVCKSKGIPIFNTVAGAVTLGTKAAQPHWITEMMVTGKEPFNADRLLLSTGIVSYNMESNWENSRYSAIGRRIETPSMNMTYRSTRGPQFSKGERPPNIPYIRGFDG